MLRVSEMDVMQMLYEVVSAIECSLGFRLAPTLMVFVASHVSIIGMHLAAEWTCFNGSGLQIAAYPSCSEGMYRIFVSDPLIACFECTGAESAEEWQVFLRFAGAIDSVGFRPVVVG
jgi:hypothetical protein